MSNGWVETGQETGFVVDDNTPLDMEEDGMAFFPESIHDHDTLVNRQEGTQRRNEAKAQQERAEHERRSRRRRAILDRVVLFIERHHLLPKSLTRINSESGERYPIYITTLRDNGKKWFWTFASVVSFVASVLWLIQWLLGAPSAVMHDGTNVVNLWKPGTLYAQDLTSSSVAGWITSHRKDLTVPTRATLRAGYYEAHIYQADEMRNITIEWLGERLQDVCKSEAEECACVPAVEIGVMTNVVYTPDGTFMMNPKITAKSDETFSVEHDDGTKMSSPIAIVVEYMHHDGKIHRKKVKLHEASCLQRSLELVGIL